MKGTNKILRTKALMVIKGKPSLVNLGIRWTDIKTVRSTHPEEYCDVKEGDGDITKRQYLEGYTAIELYGDNPGEPCIMVRENLEEVLESWETFTKLNGD
jgi:hypothetical protein